MTERTTRIHPDSERESPELLSLLASLPCVPQVVRAISTFNIGPVTELLERAAYLSLLVQAESRQGTNEFVVETAPRRFEIAAEESRSRIVGHNQAGGAVGDLRFRWRLIPDDHEGDPDRIQPLPPLPFRPEASQRVEVFDWTLRFHGGGSGFRAYGVGSTLPGAGATAPAAGVAFVLNVLEGYGELAGLAGTVVANGALGPRGEWALAVMIRVMDPAGGLLTQGLLPPFPPGAGPEPGVTYLPFLGEVDPDNPVTLRLSRTQGILGSNVFERLRTADLDHGVDPLGRPRSQARKGSLSGTLSAQLDFNPLDPCPITPIRTHRGVFTFHAQTGRDLGSVTADMIEGRSLRTRLAGMPLPVFRFAGFGPIQGGTGEFSGARGIMTMNSAISVQPRTLANLYLLRLDDPDGRFHVAAERAFGGWTS
jgi:hypothetical protein